VFTLVTAENRLALGRRRQAADQRPYRHGPGFAKPDLPTLDREIDNVVLLVPPVRWGERLAAAHNDATRGNHLEFLDRDLDGLSRFGAAHRDRPGHAVEVRLDPGSGVRVEVRGIPEAAREAILGDDGESLVRCDGAD